MSTIKLVEQLNLTYPKNNFVPIFWMASEDHDFKEVNHIYSFGKIVEWKGAENGAVGEMSLDGFESVLSELKLILGSNKILFKIADEIWFLSGDKSTDYNYYTKRIILMKIYALTFSFFVFDDSKDL